MLRCVTSRNVISLKFKNVAICVISSFLLLHVDFDITGVLVVGKTFWYVIRKATETS